MVMNQESITYLQKQQDTRGFQKPLYSDYAFSCISGTIEKLLLGASSQPTLKGEAVGNHWGPYEVVLFLLIDGFGWEFFNAYQEKCPALHFFGKEGVASAISSSFPSTTAAHLTSLHTGLEISQTGIYEWFQYEPLVDRMIAPILFSYAGDPCGDTLLKEGYTPSQLFPFQTSYQRWKSQGVRSFSLMQHRIASSAYSQAMFQGAEVIPFHTWKEALQLASSLAQQPLSSPTYIFLYFGDIDSAGHRQGICSSTFDETIFSCYKEIEEHLLKPLKHFPRKTALLLSADHGMVKVDPKKTLFLNTLFPPLEEMIATNKKGDPLLPAGSCRDFFLHIRPDMLSAAQRELSVLLKGKAEVILTDTLMREGFFGSLPPSQRLLDRVGNLAVLPHLQDSVFWHFKGHRFEQHFLGAHGGLTPQEMQSMFLFYTT